MNSPTEVVSRTGVRVAADFRDNLIIDRYDPVFTAMRASKRKHLHSANSEDAVTWNVFRSLRQINPEAWLPVLAARAFSAEVAANIKAPAVVNLWVSTPPPPALRVEQDEGESEIDVVLEAATWVWFIEAKYRGDISGRTTTRVKRDQVLRNLDVGSYYAGVRAFYFSLLIDRPERSPAGVQAVELYSDLECVRSNLRQHRPDGLQNLRGVSRLAWSDLANVLDRAGILATRMEEREYAVRALQWLQQKGLAEAAI